MKAQPTIHRIDIVTGSFLMTRGTLVLIVDPMKFYLVANDEFVLPGLYATMAEAETAVMSYRSKVQRF